MPWVSTTPSFRTHSDHSDRTAWKSRFEYGLLSSSGACFLKVVSVDAAPRRAPIFVRRAVRTTYLAPGYLRYLGLLRLRFLMCESGREGPVAAVGRSSSARADQATEA